MVRAPHRAPGMHDPTPEPAHPSAAPYRTPSRCEVHPAAATPPRRRRWLALATLATSAFAALTAVTTHAAVMTSRRCDSLVTTALASRRPSRREIALADAIDELARMGRTPLYVSPAVDARLLRGPVPWTATAGNDDVTLRALDAWSADRGLWLHVVDGVLRVEPAVTSVELRCDDTLDACAARLERAASVRVSRTPTAWAATVHLAARRGQPALDAMRDAAVSRGAPRDLCVPSR